MKWIASLALAGTMLIAAPAAAQSACQLCDPTADLPVSSRKEDERPLEIEIETGLVFSRLARAGQMTGQARLDPITGANSVEGGLIDLGGMALRGEVLVRGAPFRTVRVTLPATATLRAPDGSMAYLDRLETDLSALPTLDASGELRFSFGGALRVEGNASGSFRGRIPVSVEYD